MHAWIVFFFSFFFFWITTLLSMRLHDNANKNAFKIKCYNCVFFMLLDLFLLDHHTFSDEICQSIYLAPAQPSQAWLLDLCARQHINLRGWATVVMSWAWVRCYLLLGGSWFTFSFIVFRRVLRALVWASLLGIVVLSHALEYVFLTADAMGIDGRVVGNALT
ncbi:hypothetical protein DM01DRAFT_1123391 [Hesseltinella vesiculosa]|uniref:Uncharacterized protein n=1 Tax=Hesseltinella vesiculosa TaxID=101127 RepID=A0A1X2GTZ0_9FUNG|nr:hypothetical protein DM01DRAFT_1123391 [Hesseltinella vesiculosa]